MKLERISTALAACLLAGCVTMTAHTPGQVGETDSQLVERAWPYAQLAYNAYHRERFSSAARSFAPPEGFSYSPNQYRYKNAGMEDNDEIGLAFETALRDGTQRELIFVFRGTEGGPSTKNCDWAHGNFAFAQQRRAARLVDEYLEAHPLSDRKLVFVGHSLGGAIANYLSVRHPGSQVYMFNTSPMFRGDGRPLEPSAEAQRRRLSIANRFEFLYAARGPLREASQLYLPMNCGGGISPVARHSMLLLAQCLTKRAAAGAGPNGPPMAIAARESWGADPRQFSKERLRLDPNSPTQTCAGPAPTS